MKNFKEFEKLMEKTINIVVYTQQGKTYIFNNVIEISLRVINYDLMFSHKGVITSSENKVNFFNIAGYSILGKNAKIEKTSK